MTKPSKNKRILICVNDAWFFVSHRMPIANAIIDSGDQCHLVAHKDESVTDITNAGIEFHHWNIKPRSTSVIVEVKSIIDLYKIIKRVKPDILHLVTIKPVLYGGIIARLFKVPSVVYAISGMGHLFQDKTAKPTLIKRIAQRMYKIAIKHQNSAVIVQNTSDRSYFIDVLKLQEQNVHQLPGSGVDLNLFQNQANTNDIPIVVLTSRMLWDKGIEFYIQAAKQINLEGAKARFVLVGGCDPDNPRSIPEKTIMEWHNQGIIEYWGYRKDVAQILSSADIYCLPTIYGEGLPKAILEALSSGLAVVTTDWPGCNEVIKNKQNGFLVPPRDVAALAQALETLIENPKLRADIAKAGRETVENGYSEDIVAAKTLSIYRSLV